MNLQDLLKKLWQNHLQFLDFDVEFKNKNALDLAEIAIILSVHKDNYERYFLLKEFIDIFKKIDLRVDIFGVQSAQLCALNLLKMGFLSKQELLKALSFLEKISNNALIIDFIKALEIKNIDKKALFESNFNELNTINLELQNLTFNENSKIRLQKTLEKFKNLEFNIAITGIMNAGKSSLLNALLKEDFLGVSNIPETANLTILKYGEEQKALVSFWDKKEWQNILLSSKFSKELKEFVDTLSQELDLDEFVHEKALVKEIALKDLKTFSSAKNKLSALIKKIEIQSSLEFLKNNISIVDTPGLDDIVVQREVLTNEYLKESDFLIHLMNASQSLTQKDAEFLINCLLNSRLTKFLIVLTKADLLSQKDLDEVIAYTKESLKTRLKDIDETLVEKIDFLCVSAKKASDFYKGKASKQDFEKSGLKEFEEYLFNELYAGEKSKIALNAYKKELLLELKNTLEEYELQNKILKENEQDSDKENTKVLEQFRSQKEALEEAKTELQSSLLKLENLESGVDNLVLLLAKKLKERLIDELKYLKEKGQKPNLTRILNIIDITTKDGINDILREVKFENFKKIESLKESLSVKYDFLKDDFDDGFESFKEGISKSIDTIFSGDKFALLRLELSELVSEKEELFVLETKLTQTINSGFKGFELGQILKNLNINKAFFDFINLKLENYENTEKEKLKHLQALLEKMQDKNTNLMNSYEENLEKIAKLTELKIGLENAN